MHLTKSIITSIVVSAVAFGAAPALATAADGGQGKGRPAAGTTELPRDVLVALQRDLGLTEEQIRKQRPLQAKAIELDRTLQASLGDAFAGSTYDANTGKLVVMVSDADRVDEVRAAGAEPRLVKYSKGQLDAIKEALDVAAGKAQGSDPADRRPSGARQALVAGMTSWYVDTAANAVRVNVQKGQAAAVAAVLAQHGDAVSVQESDLAPTAAAWMDGGDLINGSTCSAGFNMRNTSTGKGFLLTAGHCVNAGSTLRGQGSAFFGPVLESWFPGYDDALARNDSGGGFVQGPWVDYNPSNGGIITTSSWTDAPVGTTICKSGITTKWTCGSIKVKDETVTYDGTHTVYGLTRHSACVEKGDSGGSNVSVTNSYSAEGVSSGASMRWDGYRYRCLSVFGGANISWYYPVADSLRYYGPKYGVSMW